MRLIDADALIEKIETEREILVQTGRLGAEHIVTHYVRNFIEDAPTVEKPEWHYDEKDCTWYPYIHITEDRITQVLDGWRVNPRTSTTAVEDEPQAEREGE